MADHTLNNTTPFISKVKLPSQSTPGQFDEYEIHDERAIHDIKDLGLATVLDFRGTKDTAEEIFMLQSAKKGDVYLVTTGDEKGTEYVCIETYQKEVTGQYPEYWEPLGDVHDAASSTHIHNVEVAVSGTVETQDITDVVTGNIKINPVTVVERDTTMPSIASGTAASWSASVNNGVLSFSWTPNEIAQVPNLHSTTASSVQFNPGTGFADTVASAPVVMTVTRQEVNRDISATATVTVSGPVEPNTNSTT